MNVRVNSTVGVARWMSIVALLVLAIFREEHVNR